MIHLSAWRDPRRRGGAELLEAWPALTEVAAAASGDGFEVTVVQAAWRDEVREHGGVFVQFVSEWGGRWMPRRLSTALPMRLIRRVEALEPDLIHYHGLGLPAPAGLLAKLGIPMLVQDHLNDVPPPSRRTLYRWGYRGASAVAFAAREQARPFVDAGILAPDTPVFELLESSTRFTPGDGAAAGIHGDPCVLWVGRLAAHKDPLTALDAFALIATRLPDARLWMAYGDAPELATVRARITESPLLRDRVHLLGRVPHARVQALFRAADFYVSASRREGGSFALLEALACGAVPLVTDIPAHRRMTRGGAVGGLYPCGSAAALAALLVEHAARPRDAERARAREHFERHLSFAALGREMRAVYARVARA